MVSLSLPSNCLVYFDGVYTEDQILVEQQPSLARRLFDTYSESVNYVDQGRLPGFAFKNNLPYIEFKLDCLLRLASIQVQTQFYQEAGIKSAVFIGCTMGEIELGFSTDQPQVNLKMEIQNMFPANLSRGGFLQRTNHSLHTTPSTSSVTSLSIGSNDYSYSYSYPYSPSLFNNIATHSPVVQPSQDEFLEEALLQHNMLNVPRTAFTGYRKGVLPPVDVIKGRRQGSCSMFKRSVLFLRNLRMGTGKDYNPIQVQHMISERRRRGKLNDSFQALRSMLPPGSKKDKASVLSSITDQLISLKSQVEELGKKNHELESKLEKERMGMGSLDSFSTKAINVEMLRDVPESESGVRFLSLSLNLRLKSRKCGVLDLVDKVVKLLKEQRGVRLVSMQSNKRLGGPNEDPLHGLVLSLEVEGNEEFNDGDLEEVVKRAVDV